LGSALDETPVNANDRELARDKESVEQDENEDYGESDEITYAPTSWLARPFEPLSRGG
jgi:hypothetical protein